jgi:hypothetical protein
MYIFALKSELHTNHNKNKKQEHKCSSEQNEPTYIDFVCPEGYNIKIPLALYTSLTDEQFSEYAREQCYKKMNNYYDDNDDVNIIDIIKS